MRRRHSDCDMRINGKQQKFLNNVEDFDKRNVILIGQT